MAELFIQNSWNLKYDTDFPVADRIGTVNLSGGGITALTPGAAFTTDNTTVLRAIVNSGDQYSGDDDALKDRTEIQNQRYLEYGRAFTFSFGFRVNDNNGSDPGFDNTADWLILFQLHQSGTSPHPPPLKLRLVGDEVRLSRGYDNGVAAPDNISESPLSDPVDVAPDGWVDVTLTVNLQQTGSSVVGWSIVSYDASENDLDDHQGSRNDVVIGYDDPVGPYAQMGIYRGHTTTTIAENFEVDFRSISVTPPSTPASFVGDLNSDTNDTFDANLQGFWLGETISGLTGNDTLRGGYDNDTIDGGSGNDKLYGGWGNDIITDPSGSNTLTGEDGNDYLTGGTGTDTLYGGNGNDTMDGGAGNDRLYDIQGTNLHYGQGGNDSIYGGVHTDSIWGHDGTDLIYGGTGYDPIRGGDGADIIHGDGDGDTLYGEVSNDTLFGGEGFDNLYGGDGDDTLDGGTDSDTLNGDAGNDTLVGGTGWNRLYGGADNDVLTGGTTNDTLDGGSGNDTLTGGTGSDRFVFGPGFGTDRITDFAVADTAEVIVFSGMTALDTWAEVSAALGHDGTWVTISGGTGNVITLVGVASTGSLTSAEFLFI